MRVLVVEDDALIADVVNDALSLAGHVVLGPVASAREALRIVGSDRPDLAVLNIDLANGGSGVDLARLLYERWSVRSVFASGHAEEAAGAEFGAIGYISKPYRPSLVVKAVAYALDTANGIDPGAVPEGFRPY